MVRSIEFNIDIKNKRYLIADAMQDDDVILTLNVDEGGRPKDLTGSIIQLDYCKSDNSVVSIIGSKYISIENNVVNIICPRECTAAIGESRCNMVISSENKQVSSFPISINVVANALMNKRVSQKNLATMLEELHQGNLEAQALVDWIKEHKDILNIEKNIENLSSQMDEKANLIKLLEENKIFYYGAKGDGITDDTQAIQSYLDSLTNTSVIETLYIAPNKVFLVNDLVINRKNLLVKGGGTIKGTIKIKFDDITFANIQFEDITFLQDTRNTDSCVEIENTFSVYFDRCNFKNGKAGVFFADKGIKHSGYSKITNCNFYYNDYCVLLDNNVSNYNGYQVADLLISNCHFHSTQKNGIYLVGIDGITIVENTAFFGSYSLKEANKNNNVYIKNCNFAIIKGNNLFESGAEAIKLINYKNTNVIGNNIAWSGQRLKTPAIYLGGTTQGNSSEFVNSNIEGNNINCPCYVGIKVDGYVTGLSVKGNQILFGGDNLYYYGDEEILLSERRSIVTTSRVLENCLITNNMYPNSIDDIKVSISYIKGTKVVNNFSQYGLVNKGYTSYYVNSSSESKAINYTDKTLLGYDNIILQGSNNITITNFGTDSMFGYRIITVISYASNVTFVHGSGIMLKNPSSTSMSANQIKKFEYYAGQWFEL